MFPFLSITDYLDEGFHIGIFLEIPKQLEQEEAHGVIGKSRRFIFIGDDGSDEGLRPVGPTPRREKSIREETNRESPPSIRPSGWILMYLRW